MSTDVGSHSHGFDSDGGAANRSRLMITIGIVSVVLVIEVIGGILSGSLALFADAGHMLSDLTGLRRSRRDHHGGSSGDGCPQLRSS